MKKTLLFESFFANIMHIQQMM